MAKAVGAAAIAGLCFCATPAIAADECETVGKLGTMLGLIDRQCPGRRLTSAGRKVMLNMAARSGSLGGEVCVAKGKAAMLRQLGGRNPELGMSAASGDTAAFNRALCEAIDSYLRVVTKSGNEPDLVEDSN